MSDWTVNVLKTVDVHPAYGTVTGHSMDPDSGHLVVDVTIPPAEDLVLAFQPAQPFCFQLLVPPGYPEEGNEPAVCLSGGREQLALLQPLLVRDAGASIGPARGGRSSPASLPRLVFSWLAGSKHMYGLGVWVFAVRHLLESPDYKPWYPPIL